MNKIFCIISIIGKPALAEKTDVMSNVEGEGMLSSFFQSFKQFFVLENTENSYSYGVKRRPFRNLQRNGGRHSNRGGGKQTNRGERDKPPKPTNYYYYYNDDDDYNYYYTY